MRSVLISDSITFSDMSANDCIALNSLAYCIINFSSSTSISFFMILSRSRSSSSLTITSFDRFALLALLYILRAVSCTFSNARLKSFPVYAIMFAVYQVMV